MQGFSDVLKINAQARDLDVENETEQVSTLGLAWTCTNLNKGLPCTKIDETPVDMSAFTSSVTIPAK